MPRGGGIKVICFRILNSNPKWEEYKYLIFAKYWTPLSYSLLLPSSPPHSPLLISAFIIFFVRIARNAIDIYCWRQYRSFF